MRGTPIGRRVRQGRRGIIPAYAGNTVVRVRRLPWLGDHPRVCGEHRHVDHRAAHGLGIIPAYAGNTTNDYDFDTPRRDHPRVCGEHFRQLSAAQKRAGSSPRMRGTPDSLTVRRLGTRIIPAYAGNTLLSRSMVSKFRDHPRVCGEHCRKHCRSGANMGSSPRMRGTPYARYQRLTVTGIIPAYAGNTAFCFCKSWLSGDHPRVCGEHLVTIDVICF